MKDRCLPLRLESVNEMVMETFPYPLAAAWARFRNVAVASPDDITAVHVAKDAFTMVGRVVSALLLADYLRLPVDQRADTFLTGESQGRPSFSGAKLSEGHWHGVVQALSRVLRASSDSFFHEDLKFSLGSSPNEGLGMYAQLVTLRNDWHKETPSRAEILEILERWTPLILGLFHDIRWIGKYRLGFFETRGEQISFSYFRGTHGFQVTKAPVGSPSDNRALWLVDPRRERALDVGACLSADRAISDVSGLAVWESAESSVTARPFTGDRRQAGPVQLAKSLKDLMESRRRTPEQFVTGLKGGSWDAEVHVPRHLPGDCVVGERGDWRLLPPRKYPGPFEVLLARRRSQTGVIGGLRALVVLADTGDSAGKLEASSRLAELADSLGWAGAPSRDGRANMWIPGDIADEPPNLSERLKSKKKPPAEDSRLQWASEVVTSTKELHDQGIAVGELEPDRIIVDATDAVTFVDPTGWRRCTDAAPDGRDLPSMTTRHLCAILRQILVSEPDSWDLDQKSTAHQFVRLRELVDAMQPVDVLRRHRVARALAALAETEGAEGLSRAAEALQEVERPEFGARPGARAADTESAADGAGPAEAGETWTGFGQRVRALFERHLWLWVGHDGFRSVYPSLHHLATRHVKAAWPWLVDGTAPRYFLNVVRPDWDMDDLRGRVDEREATQQGLSCADILGSLATRQVAARTTFGEREFLKRIWLDLAGWAELDPAASVLPPDFYRENSELQSLPASWARLERLIRGPRGWAPIVFRPPNGKLRRGLRPRHAAAQVQTFLARYLGESVDALESATAFRSHSSTSVHAAMHRRAQSAVSVDIRDFFGSTHPRHIDWLFDDSHVVDIACPLPRGPFAEWSGSARRALGWILFPYDRRRQMRALPQGAPASPALGNLAAARLDSSIRRAAARSLGTQPWVYSRYADDLTLSSSAPSGDFAQEATRILASAVESSGWKLAEEKCRVWRAGSRPLVLCGIEVGGGHGANPRLGRDQRHLLRAAIHRLTPMLGTWAAGAPSAEAELAVRRARGQVAYAYAATGDISLLPFLHRWASRDLDEFLTAIGCPTRQARSEFLLGWARHPETTTGG